MAKGKSKGPDGFGPEEEDFVGQQMEKHAKRYFIRRSPHQFAKKRRPYNAEGKVKMNYDKS